MLNYIKELINELNNASVEYYNTGKSPLSDKEFDAKMDELSKLEKDTGIILSNSPTQNVGAPVVSEISKIDISDKPMLSLDKCHTVDEITEFAKGQNLVASIKCDGLSCRIIYENGHIVSANTRGNGNVGGDITEHIKHFINVPLTVPTLNRLVVDGEAIINQTDFNDINKDKEFKNPRNLAAGTLACLDTSLCTSRRLSFILWDVIEFDQPIKSYSDVINFMKNYGFTVVPNMTAKSDFDFVNKKIFEKANELGIPIDGVVYKYDDVNFDTTRTAKFFNNAIAFKFKDEEAETKLVALDWDVSRNGVLTPVAVVEPVELDGSTVERCSVHNISILYTTLHTPFVGQSVKIVKKNMIIPQIVWAEEVKKPDTEIKIPEICPSCGELLVIEESADGVQTLLCRNEKCTCRFINRMDHFCGKAGLDIKGLSKQTLEKLESQGWILKISDLFNLKRWESEWKNLPGFGDKSVSKILDSIDEARNTTLEQILSAIGIPLIGRTMAKDISKRVKGSYDNYRRLVDDSRFTFEEWDGYGVETNNALKNFDYTELDELVKKYLIIKKVEEEKTTDSLAGVTFVITGKLSKTRDAIKADIEKAGGKVATSVSRKTNYLVCNNPENTTKYNKAVEFNIPIITEKELWEKMK